MSESQNLPTNGTYNIRGVHLNDKICMQLDSTNHTMGVSCNQGPSVYQVLQVGSNDNMTQYTIQETRSMLFLADNTTTDVNGSVIAIPDTYYWNFSAPSAPSFGARIMPWNSSQCITLSRGDQGGLNGTAILIQDCSGKPNQEWLFQKSNSSDLD